MFPNIVICENPAGDKQLAILLIPTKYLKNSSKLDGLEAIPGVIPINYGIEYRDLSRENLRHQVIINIDLNREPNINRNNLCNFCISNCLYVFCKYICCGFCIFFGILLDRICCTHNRLKQLFGCMLIICCIFTVLAFFKAI